MFNPADWPIAWMARAERQHARNATALLAPLGLHHREFRLMAILANSQGLTVGELAEQAVLERPTVSKMIDRLAAEGDGAARRRPQAHDGAQRRRLAGAVAAQQHRHLALGHDEVDAVQDVIGADVRVHAAQLEDGGHAAASAALIPR